MDQEIKDSMDLTIFNWNPLDHPRNLLGQFRKVLGNLNDGDSVMFPDGTYVDRSGPNMLVGRDNDVQDVPKLYTDDKAHVETARDAIQRSNYDFVLENDPEAARYDNLSDESLELLEHEDVDYIVDSSHDPPVIDLKDLGIPEDVFSDDEELTMEEQFAIFTEPFNKPNGDQHPYMIRVTSLGPKDAPQDIRLYIAQAQAIDSDINPIGQPTEPVMYIGRDAMISALKSDLISALGEIDGDLDDGNLDEVPPNVPDDAPTSRTDGLKPGDWIQLAGPDYEGAFPMIAKIIRRNEDGTFDIVATGPGPGKDDDWQNFAEHATHVDLYDGMWKEPEVDIDMSVRMRYDRAEARAEVELAATKFRRIAAESQHIADVDHDNDTIWFRVNTSETNDFDVSIEYGGDGDWYTAAQNNHWESGAHKGPTVVDSFGRLMADPTIGNFDPESVLEPLKAMGFEFRQVPPDEGGGPYKWTAKVYLPETDEKYNRTTWAPTPGQDEGMVDLRVVQMEFVPHIGWVVSWDQLEYGAKTLNEAMEKMANDEDFQQG